jgi:hypothetical protein
MRRASPRSFAPLAVVGAAVLFNAVVLRAELHPAWYLNDSSIHASMARWAAERIREGHLPFDGWYPYLSLGASRFHHYQSLPHILTAVASLAFGRATFAWSAYLLLVTWPISVYAGARLFGFEPWHAAAAAAVSPLVSSAPGLGYEYGSYLWIGSGTWSQLWGMWALPFALALSWRAVARDGSLALGAAAVGLTVCLHLLTGYLALLAVGVWVVLEPSRLRHRLVRGAIVGAGALLVAAWMLVPLLLDRAWTTQDEFSRGTYFYDSFGARRVLGWLVTGRLFDARRSVPFVTILAGVGLVRAIARWRRDEGARAVLAFGLLSLLLFFGRPTLGPLLRLLPGSGDLFLRRYVSGVHLAGILLAGAGAVVVVRAIASTVAERWRRRGAIAWAASVGVVTVLLLPAAIERVSYGSRDASAIARQRIVDASAGRAVADLVRIARQTGPGRIYAGLRAKRGTWFTLGVVPSYAALLDLDADAIGFTRPTWSLMSNVEARFDPTDPDQYPLFGIRYVISPSATQPSPPARRLAGKGAYSLWEVPGVRYVTVGDSIAPIAADRTDLGVQMASYLDSGLPARALYPTLAFGGRVAAAPTLGPDREPADPAGVVENEVDGPADGFFAARVRMARAGVVVLRSSFDPRWTASVDGYAVAVQPLAPGIVGVRVPPGIHEVVMAYRSFPAYGLLFALVAFSIAALAFADRRLSASPEEGTDR